MLINYYLYINKEWKLYKTDIMAQEEKKEKTYTEKEVKKLLQKQKELCKTAIDAENISKYTARKKIGEAKLATEK